MAERGDAYYDDGHYLSTERDQRDYPSAIPFPASGSSPSTRSPASSTAISSFFARGAKFFNKSNQIPKSPASQQQPPEALLSAASGSPPRAPVARSRLRNVSGPSNLRPVLPANSGGLYSQPNHLAARSVVDLGAGRRSNSEQPPLPANAHAAAEDLRAVSNKSWAHSADDLGAMLNASASHDEETSPNFNAEPVQRRQEIPKDSARKPSLNLRIEAYRNNLGQFAQQPSPSFSRDVPSPAYSASSSPMAQRFPTPSHDKTSFGLSTSDSSPVVGSTLASNTAHNRSNSYNVLGSTQSVPSQDPPRHKQTGSGNMPNFSFPFGGGKTHGAARPKVEIQAADNRRASQVVYHSGFLNRNGSTSFPLNLNKHWKAYKAEIKGPKLHLYKPPGEKANGVRDLFATEWGAQPVEEAEEHSPSVQTMSDSSSSRKEGRRKRLFWGPGRHPETIFDEHGVLVAGTVESLVYELVFAASFDTRGGEEWSQFAQVVLLAIPALVGEEKFEADLPAVIDRYIRYAESDVVRQERQQRMEWLLSVYASFYHPQGLSQNLEAFANSCNLRVKLPPIPTSAPFKLPKPPLVSPKRSIERPNLHRGPSSSISSDLVLQSQGSTLADLRHKGNMSREKMMTIDTNVLAQSLDLFLLKEAISSRQAIHARPVISCLEEHGWPWPSFSEKDGRPHWLTHFIVVQIVCRSDGTVTVSSTHSRASALSKWIRIAERARQSGNECVWKAISTALTSKPVARLEKAWRRVDSTDRQAVEGWVKGEKVIRGSTNQIPWLSRASKQLYSDLHQLKIQSVLDMELMQKVHNIVKSVHDGWKQCTTEGFAIDHADVLDLFHLWEVVITKDGKQVRPLVDYVSESLQAEPVQFGRLAQYFHQPRSSNYPLHALVPFTFPEPLPSLAFLDRSELVRLRKESLDKHGNPTPQDLQMEHLSRLKFFPSEHVRSHWTSKEGIELDDTIFRLFGGEMIVKVVKDAQPGSRPASFFDNGATSLSRRPSRAPSIRVKPQAASALERKSSAARRQSMPLLNNGRPRVTPAAEGKPKGSMDLLVPVVIVGGTIERLVDVLVRGLDYVMAATSDDNGEMALTDRRARGLKLDRDDYSKTWWSTYRSFLTPEVLIAMLRKQFRTTVQSPHISHINGSHDLSADANLRMAIMTVLNEWLIDGGGVMDVLDQPDLYTEVSNWLHDDNEHAIPAAVKIGGLDHPAWQEVEDARTTLITLFEAQTKRPQLRHLSTYDSGAYSSSIRSYGAQLPDPDRMSPQELVEQLDAIGSVGIRGLQAEDLVACMEILEIQSKDKTGWVFLSDLPTLSQDEMIIQNIYFHLTLMEPTPLLSDFPPTQRLTNLAQPSIRAMLYCFDEARKWATAVLAQPGIPIEARHRRMELFLQALDMCRLLSSKTDGVAHGEPVIRSFVETVLSTAILSPESRMFQRAWHHVAIQRRIMNVESLESFLKPVQDEELPFPSGFKLAVDFGWMIERLLEMISMPDTLVNTTDALGIVINFEKRRHLYTFILNMPTLATSRPSKQRSQLNNVDLVRLHNMYEWAAKILSDSNGNIGVSQIIKEEAFRENTHAPQGSAPRKYPKPFSKVVLLQQEKNKRDRHIRDRLLREKRMEQLKREKQNVPYDKAMDASKKSKQGKRTSLNPFMRVVVRPLSTAFPFGGVPPPHSDGAEAKKWTLEELDFMPTSKPSLSIDLAGARIEERKNNARPFIFTLETEDGVKYYFQATTQRELTKWLTQLTKTSKSTSEKRRTYVGVPAGYNDFYGAPKNLGRHPTAVFAVPLEFLLEREYGSIQAGAIPAFLEQCLDEVEARGFTEDGIYRISGSKLQIDRIKAEVNAGRHVNLHDQDIHNVCSLVKLWIREIPDGLMPGECFWLAVEAVQTNDHSQAIDMIRHAISKMPLAHFNVLRRVLEHLTVGSTHEDQTRMAEKQFSLVFGQTILTPPEQGGIKALNAGIQYGNRVVEVMLNHYHAIFEGEGDGDDDDEEQETTVDAAGEMHFLEGLEEEDEEQSS